MSSLDVGNFFLKCHSLSLEELDSSAAVPSRLPPDEFHFLANEGPELWRTYLAIKFTFFCSPTDVRASSRQAAVESLALKTDRDMAASFVNDWEQIENNEETAYRIRCSQLSSDIVDATWYYIGIAECQDWCKRLKERFAKEDRFSTNGQLQDELKHMYESVGTEPFTEHKTEARMTALLKAVTQRHLGAADLFRTYLMNGPFTLGGTEPAHLSEETGFLNLVNKCLSCLHEQTPADFKVNPRKALLDAESLGTMYTSLVQAFYANMFDETETYRCFLKIIRERFHCEIVDYMVPNGEYIDWKVATVGMNELSPEYQKIAMEDQKQLEQEIQKHESYRRGVGISGCALLLKDNLNHNLWNHLGSNHVQADPRQSQKHTIISTPLFSGMRVKHTPETRVLTSL